MHRVLRRCFTAALLRGRHCSSATNHHHYQRQSNGGAVIPLTSQHPSLLQLCKAGRLDQALHLLLQIPDPLPPHHDHFCIAFLRSCQNEKDLLHTTLLLTHLSQRTKYELSGKLGDYFVITLVKCGGIQEALRLFLRLSSRSVYSWTAVISGFTHFGYGWKAIGMLECMQKDGFQPNHFTLVSLLKACGSIGCLQEGRKIHALVRNKGLDSDIFISTSLISMYSKCGSLRESEDVFNELLDCNVVSWNAMLSAYLQHNQAEKVLELYRKLADEGMEPNDVTFMVAIQSCGILASKEEVILMIGQVMKPVSISIGHALHADAKKKGFSTDVGNALVNLYGKCLSISEAHNVFNSLCSHNVASWNAMISTYVEFEQVDSALCLFNHMLKEGVSPDVWTFVITLQACCILADKEESTLVDSHFIKPICLDIVCAIHDDVEQNGFASHIFVGNSLLTTYGKCGDIKKAKEVFCSLHNSNVISWNAMLSVYIEQDQNDMALHLYRQMVEDRVSSSEQTFTIAIQACVNILDKQETISVKESAVMKTAIGMIGKALHADALKKGFTLSAYVGNNLVTMYGKCGMIVEAEYAFEGLSQSNIVSWNVMLLAYVNNGYGEAALQLFKLMWREGTTPSRLAFKFALRACGILADKEGVNWVKDIVQALHVDIIKEGFIEDILLGSTLMSIYSKLGLVNEVEKVFGDLFLDDVMPWNVMLSAYVENDLNEEALKLYKKILDYSVADDATLVCIVQACGNLGCICFCRELHFIVISTGHIKSSLMITTLIHAYGNCGSMIDAELLINELPKSDVVTWSAYLAGYAKQGNLIASLQVLKQMEWMLYTPNGVTFLSVFNACNHAGLVYIGVQYFILMQSHYGINPDFKCYASMIDMMGRAGDFIRVENLLEKTPKQNGNIWICMLGGCHIHGNMGLGTYAFQHAVELHPEDAAVYVSMANIYSNS